MRVGHWSIGGEGGIGVLINIDYILCCLRGLYAAPQVVYAAPQVLSLSLAIGRQQVVQQPSSENGIQVQRSAARFSVQLPDSRLVAKSECWEIFFGSVPLIIYAYILNEAHE